MGKALEQYLEQKIAEIDRNKDTANLVGRGRFSFDMDSTTYGHLPAWAALVKEKKSLMKWVWIDALIVSLCVVSFAGEYWEAFEQSWLKAIVKLLLTSGLIMFLYVITSYYNLFVKFRMTERQARKLIYQDILHRLKQEKETIAL